MFDDHPPLSTHWQATFLYGPPLPSLKRQFWDDLNTIGDTFTGAWLMVGDFNAVLDPQDKLGGNQVATSSMDGFRHMIDTNGLIDVGYCGHPFTWTNR